MLHEIILLRQNEFLKLLLLEESANPLLAETSTTKNYIFLNAPGFQPNQSSNPFTIQKRACGQDFFIAVLLPDGMSRAVQGYGSAPRVTLYWAL
jgi:hypothetical protein